MPEAPPRFGLRNLAALAALAAWGWYAAAAGPDDSFPGRALGVLVQGLAVQALWFVPVGALVPLVLPRMRGVLSSFFLVLLPSVPIAGALTVLVAAAPEHAPWTVLQTFEMPGVLGLLAPLAGTLAGVLLGTVLANGLGAALLLIPALLGIGAVLLAITAVALLVLTDRVAAVEPVGSPAPAAPAYRAAVESAAPGDGGATRIAFDADALASALRLAVAAAGLSPTLRLGLAPRGGELEAVFSLPVEVPVAGPRFVNFRAAAQPALADGDFRAGLRSVSVGGLSVPHWWVRPASRVVSRWLARGSPLASVLRQMHDAGVEFSVEGASLIVLRSPGAERGAAEAPLVADYLARLEHEAEAIRNRPDRIAGALEAVFRLAAERSQVQGAVSENRAALLALGGAAGHPALLSLAGFPDAARAAGELGEALELTLSGRQDWARHFLLSAGLTQVAPDGLPEQVSLIKESLDAEAGGSGFSFTDLLMDAAGRRFALVATSSEPEARRMQEAVLAGIGEGDLAPRNAGLPEGLSSERLEEELGGVDGPGFRALEAEITSRLDDLPLYRGSAAGDPRVGDRSLQSPS